MIFMKKRLLIVEDEHLPRTLLCEVLTGAFDIEAAVTVATGLTRCGELPKVDAILLDLRLPNGQGIAVIEAFHQRFPDVAICVYTGMDDLNVARALAAGAKHVLFKGQTQPAEIIDGVYRALSYQAEDRSYRPIAEALDLVRQKMVAAIDRHKPPERK
jgi:CheY-like chemotaxis protein